MTGELTIEEKLNMTSSALKTLHTQLFEAELHGIANTIALRENKEAKRAQADRENALKIAINQLNNKYLALEKLNLAPTDASGTVLSKLNEKPD